MSECESITQLLSAIPETYHSVTTAIDILFCQNISEVTIDFVKSKLLMEEVRQNKLRGEAGISQQVFTAESRRPPSKKFQFNCYYCGKKG